jgi:hypothetical protein
MHVGELVARVGADGGALGERRRISHATHQANQKHGATETYVNS